MPFQIINTQKQLTDAATTYLQQHDCQLRYVYLEPLSEAEDWIARHEAFWQGTLRRLEGYLGDPATSEDRS